MRSLASALLLSSALTANAAVLLTVNISDPTNVTFAATGAFSAIDNSDYTTEQGVDLMAFFTGSVKVKPPITPTIIGPAPVAGGLFANGTSVTYNDWDVDSFTAPGGVDLNLFYAGGGGGEPTIIGILAGAAAEGYQQFSTTSAAFTGSATFDLSMGSAFLPQAGASGEIRPGWFGGGEGSVLGESIGQWLVIPEPSTYAFCFGFGALAVVTAARRFRRR